MVPGTEDPEIMFHMLDVAENLSVSSLKCSQCTVMKTVPCLGELLLLGPTVVSSLCVFSDIFV